MSAITESLDTRTICPHCNAPLRPGARFCAACGYDLHGPDQVAPAQLSQGSPLPKFWIFVGLLAVSVLVGTFALINTIQQRRSLASANRRIAGLTEQLGVSANQQAALARRVSAMNARLDKTNAGVAPLAKQILKSVFTVETSNGSLGTAWAAWTGGDSTYLITANHVISDSGVSTVAIRQRAKRWSGTIIKTDAVNDLALIRVPALVGPLLWQTPNLDISPLPGDQLLLVGSPYGLEGTVTTGVVSRITYNQIQTDAAANPGNSGGPAVDPKGEVVGVLLSGGGENLNFAVPIQRACVTIRSC